MRYLRSCAKHEQGNVRGLFTAVAAVIAAVVPSAAKANALIDNVPTNCVPHDVSNPQNPSLGVFSGCCGFQASFFNVNAPPGDQALINRANGYCGGSGSEGLGVYRITDPSEALCDFSHLKSVEAIHGFLNTNVNTDGESSYTCCGYGMLAASSGYVMYQPIFQGDERYNWEGSEPKSGKTDETERCAIINFGSGTTGSAITYRNVSGSLTEDFIKGAWCAGYAGIPSIADPNGCVNPKWNQSMKDQFGIEKCTYPLGYEKCEIEKTGSASWPYIPGHWISSSRTRITEQGNQFFNTMFSMLAGVKPVVGGHQYIGDTTEDIEYPNNTYKWHLPNNSFGTYCIQKTLQNSASNEGAVRGGKHGAYSSHENWAYEGVSKCQPGDANCVCNCDGFQATGAPNPIGTTGRYYNRHSRTCNICPNGTYPTELGDACRPCGKGHYCIWGIRYPCTGAQATTISTDDNQLIANLRGDEGQCSTWKLDTVPVAQTQRVKITFKPGGYWSACGITCPRSGVLSCTFCANTYKSHGAGNTSGWNLSSWKQRLQGSGWYHVH